MKISQSQRGHAHIILAMVGILAFVGFAGFAVYSKQNVIDIKSSVAALPPLNTCDDIENLPDDQYDQVPDDVYDRLCGAEQDDPPSATDDPTLATPGPCANLTDEQIDAMTDEQYAAQCGDGTSTDETTDGGAVSPAANTVTGANGKPVTIALSKKTECVNSVTKLSLKDAKAFENKRIANRVKSLKAADKKLAAHYGSSSVSKSLKARQKVANKQLKATATKYHKSAGGQIRVSTPKTHKSALKTLVKTTNKKLTTAKTGVKSGKTAEQVAVAGCGGIFDTQVIAYTIPKIKAQQSIDSLYAQNAAYEINYKLVTKLAKVRGKSVGSSLSTPAANKARIDGLQKSLDAVTVTSVNAALDGGASSKTVVSGSISSGQAGIKTTLKHDDKAAKNRIKVLRK